MARKVKFSVANELKKLNKGKRHSKKLFAALVGNEVGGQQPGTWPMRSLALAVHPKDVAAGNAFLKKHGVNAHHDRTGKMVIPDAKTRARVIELKGMKDFS